MQLACTWWCVLSNYSGMTPCNCPVTSAWRVQLSNYCSNQGCWWPIRFENFDIVMMMMMIIIIVIIIVWPLWSHLKQFSVFWSLLHHQFAKVSLQPKSFIHSDKNCCQKNSYFSIGTHNYTHFCFLCLLTKHKILFSLSSDLFDCL